MTARRDRSTITPATGPLADLKLDETIAPSPPEEVASLADPVGEAAPAAEAPRTAYVYGGDPVVIEPEIHRWQRVEAPDGSPIAAPVTREPGVSEPGYVAPEPPAGVPVRPPQAHADRLHELLDLVTSKVDGGFHWATDEIRSLLHTLGHHRGA